MLLKIKKIKEEVFESDEAAAYVKCYARNDHLGLAIGYEFQEIDHSYEPDFLVRLTNDVTLLLEIKGYKVHQPERNNAKHGAARRWVEAVNNLKEFGRWDFHVCRDLDQLAADLARIGSNAYAQKGPKP